jgi:hypothetical protein
LDEFHKGRHSDLLVSVHGSEFTVVSIHKKFTREMPFSSLKPVVPVLPADSSLDFFLNDLT